MKILVRLILIVLAFAASIAASASATSSFNLRQIKAELKRFSLCIGAEKVQAVKDVIGEDMHVICGVELGNVSLSSQNLKAIKHCMDNTRFMVQESRLASMEYQVFYRCRSIYPINLSLVSGQSGLAIKEIFFVYQ